MRATASKVPDRQGSSSPSTTKPAASLSGISTELAAKLEKLGIRTWFDLVLHLPLRYEDETRLATIATARPGEAAQLEVRVLDSSVQYRPRRQLVCRVGDETGELILRFFSFYPNQARQLEPGALLRVFGEVRGGFWGAEIVPPRFHAVLEGDPLPQALTPIYPTTAVPNPMLEENRTPTIDAIKKEKADLGVAWDGDYDRCFFFDEKGNFIEGYYIVGLLAKSILKKNPGGKIVHDPRLVWNTVEIVEKFGGEAVVSKSGHAFIKQKMREVNSIYGGEMSAHHYSEIMLTAIAE